jgi:hypothetical protein
MTPDCPLMGCLQMYASEKRVLEGEDAEIRVCVSKRGASYPRMYEGKEGP